jgi:hypothetical protein
MAQNENEIVVRGYPLLDNILSDFFQEIWRIQIDGDIIGPGSNTLWSKGKTMRFSSLQKREAQFDAWDLKERSIEYSSVQEAAMDAALDILNDAFITAATANNRREGFAVIYI